VGASGGAGSLAAQYAADQHASAVISGDFGPNAFNVLQAAGIAMYLFGVSTTVRQAIEHYKADQLEIVGGPTGGGHHWRK
jgi:predicted Fe-Mo cluster-binding NifX family protein